MSTQPSDLVTAEGLRESMGQVEQRIMGGGGTVLFDGPISSNATQTLSSQTSDFDMFLVATCSSSYGGGYYYQSAVALHEHGSTSPLGQVSVYAGNSSTIFNFTSTTQFSVSMATLARAIVIGFRY